jgi:hypothetical protein
MNNLTAKQWYIVAVLLAFVSFISFANINSSWADEHNFNGWIGFFGLGILSGLLTILSLIRSNTVK